MIEHMRLGRACLIVVGSLASGFLLIRPTLGGVDHDQLLATARDGNRAAILSITSMECKYERRPWGDTTLEQAAKYWHIRSPGRFWRSGDTYRLFKPMSDGTTLDYVVRNGQGHYLRKGGPLPRPILTLEALKPVDGIGGEMWQWLLFSHWGWNPPSYYLLDDILQHPHEVRTAERLAAPANDIHIEMTHSGGRLEFWFDPKVNYLIRKQVMVPAGDSNYRWEDEVIEFVESAPTVFVPSIIEHRCFIKGTLEGRLRTILSEIKINQSLASNALHLPGIAGMDCLELNRDVKYIVGADGNPAGAESPYEVVRILPRSDTKSSVQVFTPDLNAYREPSRSPTPWWVWILIASTLVLATALGLAVVRRRRQATRS